MQIDGKYINAINCEHPRIIYRNGSRMYVPCGKCSACMLNKSRLNVQYLDLESKSSVAQRFVTLTYADKYLPVFEVNSIPEPLRQFSDINLRAALVPRSAVPTDLDDLNYYKGEVSFGGIPNEQIYEVSARQEQPLGYFAALYKPDIQRFVKRVNDRYRNFIKKYNKRYYGTKFELTEQEKEFKMRYFCVGEYGPLHLRPHYHLYFCFSSERLARRLRTYIRTCWKYGRTDCQIPHGGCENYVGGYLNSYASLPPLLSAVRRIKGFSTHSNRFGFGFLDGEKHKIYSSQEVGELDPSVLRFVRKDIRSGKFGIYKPTTLYYQKMGDYYQISMHKHVKARYFPSTLGGCFKDRQSIKDDFLSLSWFDKFYNRPNLHSQMARAKFLLNEIRKNWDEIALLLKPYFIRDRRVSFSMDSPIHYLANLVAYFPELYSLDKSQFEWWLMKPYAVERRYLNTTIHRCNKYKLLDYIAKTLRISNHFLTFILDGSITDADDMIDYLLSYRDISNHECYDSFYSTLEDTEISDEFKQFSLPFGDVKVSDVPEYIAYRSDNKRKVSERIKHKALNDSLGLLKYNEN